MPLGEEAGFACVDVFGLRIGAEPTPAERNDPAAGIADRKHQPVEKEIAGAAVFIAGPHKTGRNHIVQRHIFAGQMIFQRVAGRRIAKPETACRFTVQAPHPQVILCRSPCPAAQPVLKKLAGEFDDVVKRLFLLLAGLVIGAPFRQFDTGLARQALHGLGKAQAVHFHQPFEGIAARAAAEAVIAAPFVLHLEGGRFFLVKRTTAPEHPALAGQLHAPAHELDNICPPEDFFEQAGTVAHPGNVRRYTAICAGKTDKPTSFPVFRQREETGTGLFILLNLGL